MYFYALCGFRDLEKQFLDPLDHFHMTAGYIGAGSSLERVQRVHLHPSISGNGCSAPVLKSISNEALKTVIILSKIGKF